MPTNPFYQPVYFDSCAFDGGDESEQQASFRGRVLLEDNEGTIIILHSVQNYDPILRGRYTAIETFNCG